jgi:hypothetical protein
MASQPQQVISRLPSRRLAPAEEALKILAKSIKRYSDVYGK